ncbi:hypothetical protein IBTHAUMO2_360001 [Nitrosopumilaceae archaeon]|nr:hypothetical protein [Nitrosopumilus sp.]MDA8001292.1 hypothetical protein [Alphaproteobacteria bacterium]CAI9831678.1 hypothetical protein IBTHAUMO2_360001 [Nitrosopumilaceae archaeon]
MSETDQDRPSGTTRLEAQVREAVRLAQIVPEEYRAMALELLLKLLCSTDSSVYNVPAYVGESIDNRYNLPVSVASFMARFNIPESNINHYFSITGPDEIAPKYVIKNRSAARSQIQIACMKALERALDDGLFEFSYEDVRVACKEHDCFDDNNFHGNFKRKYKLFKSLDDKEHVVLSPLGKEYLADLLDELSNKS